MQFIIFVEIFFHLFGDYKQMLFKIERIIKFEHIFGFQVICIIINIFKQFDFINGLIEIVLIIFDDFETDIFVGEQVFAADRLRKGCLSQVGGDLVSARDHRMDYDRKLFRFFEACSFPVENHVQIKSVVPNSVRMQRVVFYLLRKFYATRQQTFLKSVFFAISYFLLLTLLYVIYYFLVIFLHNLRRIIILL